METQNGPRTLRCELCGASFGCSPEPGSHCWCRDVSLSDFELKELRSKYSDCICPECLRKHASRPDRFQKP